MILSAFYPLPLFTDILVLQTSHQTGVTLLLISTYGFKNNELSPRLAVIYQGLVKHFAVLQFFLEKL